MLTEHLPRVPLAQLPTPLEEMPRFRQALGGGPRLLIKRDDQTGLATGGNKARKLEFAVAEALEQEADTLITTGGPQSNHCRQTAAAAAKMGLHCVLVLGGNPIPRSQWNGNLLLNDLLGAQVRWVGDRDRDVVLAETAEELRAAGRRPYVVPLGASYPIGAVGYVAATEELAEQLTEREEKVDCIVLTSGSGGTHAGVLVGIKALGLEIRVEGIDNAAIPAITQKVQSLAAETAAYLGLDLDFFEDDFIIHAAYGVTGYGVITDAEREAIRLLARTEGIIADPVYTGRALAGLIDLIRKNVYGPSETLLFWHTGGVAALFARAADFTS